VLKTEVQKYSPIQSQKIYKKGNCKGKSQGKLMENYGGKGGKREETQVGKFKGLWHLEPNLSSL